jgi:FkbM family methyltransferase
MRASAFAQRIVGSVFARLSPQLREQVATLVERRFEEIVYRRLANRGFRPGGLIDIGAFRGGWTRMARSIFDNPPTLMVEAQAALIPDLRGFATNTSGVQCAHALLARQFGRAVEFHEMGTGSSMFAEASDVQRTSRMMETETLDRIAAAALPGASDLFVKIDVQGAELEVLSGASETLSRSALVQLETAMLPYNAGAPLLPEVVNWMAEQGWLPIEVSGFSRPSEQLVQVDLLFAPEPSLLRPKYFMFQDDSRSGTDEGYIVDHALPGHTAALRTVA